MKIVRLEAANVKRLRAVEITPGGDPLVFIRGNNAQGKSSLLDAISYALGGKGTHPPRVIRDGETEAHVLLELDDLVVERRWTANDRSTVEVRSKAGAKYPSPQAMLDRLVGRLSFDPLAFMRLPGREQAEALRKLVGLDFSALDAQRADLYAKRTEANRLLGELQAQAKALGEVPAVEPVDVRALLDEQRVALERKASNDAERRRLADMEGLARVAGEVLARKAEEVEDLRRRLAKAEEEAKQTEVERDHRLQVAARFAGDLAGLTDPDLTAIGEKLAGAEAVNTQARKAAERATLDQRVAKGTGYRDALAAQIDAVDAKKAEALGGAKFPVEGLSFGEEGATFRGVPLSQASAAEQLRVSLGMGIALNPELRVLTIRDGSLLDEESLRMVAEQAAAADVQVWLESVSKAGVGVVIEDGSVVAVDGVPVPKAEPAPAPKARKKKGEEVADG